MQCLNRGLSIVGGVVLLFYVLSKRHYDTKRYYTTSYNIFDLKLLHLKTIARTIVCSVSEKSFFCY